MLLDSCLNSNNDDLNQASSIAICNLLFSVSYFVNGEAYLVSGCLGTDLEHIVIANGADEDSTSGCIREPNNVVASTATTIAVASCPFVLADIHSVVKSIEQAIVILLATVITTATTITSDYIIKKTNG